MSMDELLNSKITIRDALDSGYLSARILSDHDIWTRVQIVKDEEKTNKTNAIETVSEKCRVARSTVWLSYSMYEKITPKLIGLE